MHVKLFVNLPDMRANGMDADAESIGNLLIAFPRGEPVENIMLPFGQYREVFGGWSGVKKAHHLACDGQRHRGSPRANLDNGVRDLRRRCPLEQIAAGPCLERLEDHRGIFENGEDEAKHRWGDCFQARYAFDAACAGQIHIYQSDFRLGARNFAQGFFGARINGEASDARAGPVEKTLESAGEGRGIFDQGDADWGHASL